MNYFSPSLHTLIMLMGLSLTSCRSSLPEEKIPDYDSLFPFTGIEKPKVNRLDMNLRICNPKTDIKDFKYPGISYTEEIREYDITLTCKYEYLYKEQGTEHLSYTPDIQIRYIDERNTLQVVRTKPSNENPYDKVLEEDVKFSTTFRVKSGYPLYLSVDGYANTNTQVTASISAKSLDGIIQVPTLSIQQVQTQEGPQALPIPYCNYILLP